MSAEHRGFVRVVLDDIREARRDGDPVQVATGVVLLLACGWLVVVLAVLVVGTLTASRWFLVPWCVVASLLAVAWQSTDPGGDK